MGLVDRKDDSQASRTSSAIINLLGQCVWASGYIR